LQASAVAALRTVTPKVVQVSSAARQPLHKHTGISMFMARFGAALGLCALAWSAYAAPLHNYSCDRVANRYHVNLTGQATYNDASAVNIAVNLADTYGLQVVEWFNYGWNQWWVVYDNLTPGAAQYLAQEQGWQWRVGVVESACRMHFAAQQGPTPPAPWHLDLLDGFFSENAIYQYAGDGAGAHIFVLDGGIVGAPGAATANYSAHVDLAGRLGAGVDVSDLVPTPVGGPWQPSIHPACFNHGTSVAGLAAGTTHGVAKGAIVHSVRIGRCDYAPTAGPEGPGTIVGSTDPTALARGARWIRDQVLVNGYPAVANFSGYVGYSGSDGIMARQAMQNLRAIGVTVVNSAGNDATDVTNAPPSTNNDPDSVIVGAATRTLTRAVFSNHGTIVDLFAPGDSIIAPRAYFSNPRTGSELAPVSGTSFAAPLVAGAIARYLARNPTAGLAAGTAVINNAAAGAMKALPPGTPNRFLNTTFLDTGGVEVTAPSAGLVLPNVVSGSSSSASFGVVNRNQSAVTIEFRVNGSGAGCTLIVNGGSNIALQRDQAATINASIQCTTTALPGPRAFSIEVFDITNGQTARTFPVSTRLVGVRADQFITVRDAYSGGNAETQFVSSIRHKLLRLTAYNANSVGLFSNYKVALNFVGGPSDPGLEFGPCDTTLFEVYPANPATIGEGQCFGFMWSGSSFPTPGTYQFALSVWPMSGAPGDWVEASIPLTFQLNP